MRPEPPSKPSPRALAWRRWALVFLSLAALAAASVWGIRGLGYWLVVEDPLSEARAIVVLSGHLPFRAIGATAIYRQGWAPEVWVTKDARPDEEAALARIDISVISEGEYNRRVLERLGVPPSAIRILTPGVLNTAQELQLVAQELARVGGDRVILVTSKPHTRRVRAAWQALAGRSLRAIVRYPQEDPFDPARWWRHTQDALAVSREVPALLNVWAGFPVRPDREP